LRSPDLNLVRRLFDAVSASAGLVLLLPVFAVLALAIVLDDGPPVLFRQTRIGRGGRPFRLWKFRTMHVGSRGRAITAAGDHRVTRVGAALRKWKLDELPQLFNVLVGDMSLVGPRPEVPEFVEPDSPVWDAVLKVRPGITDLATLFYRSEERLLGAARDPVAFYRETVLPAKLRLNLKYMASRSFAQDLRLIWLSIRYSLFPAGFDAERIRRSFD
jgi:lipopolysaccharide/colanic/teichoic acid biosynthesis glycosyltransferase